MKLCFPVEADNGLESPVYGHFGSAPCFIVFDTETKAVERIDNQNLGHAHGMCNPLKALNGQMVDVLVVGGIGAGAIQRLNTLGIKVYRGFEGTVQENIGHFENRVMTEITMDQACGGHGGGCGQ
jgi:predicted Fe-Mo cluster-binding NifX family protein